MDKNSREKIYFSIIEWGTYLIMFTPFIFIKDYFFPFVVPKTVFFRIIVDIIFIPYVLLAVSNPRYRPKFNNPLTIAIIIFLGITILTSLTGINLERSFWSVFERMTGILTFLHLFVFYIILTSVFKERKYWERILAVAILVGLLICFYTWTSKEPTTRGGGTIGNTSFMAAYLLFDIFFAIILFFSKKGMWKVFSGLSLIVFLCGLFISIEPCRGAIGALLIALFLEGFGYLIYYLLSSGKEKLKKTAFLLIILFVFGSLGLFQTQFVKDKIASEWYSGSMQSRMLVWKIGFEGWKERFWLGWGQDNFNIPFFKYFDPKLPLTQDVWYDRAHNIVIDVAVASGIFGLLSYIGIFVVAIIGLIRIVPKISERKNVVLPLGMICLLIAYFIQNIFVFDMISSYCMFFFSLAFINFLMGLPKEKETINYPDKRSSLSLFIGALLIIVSIITLYFGNIQPARASKYVLRGVSYPLEYATQFFQKALDVSPISQSETPEQLSMRMNSFLYQQNQNKDLLDKGLKMAEEELKKAISRHPLDYRVRLFLGKYYNSLYQANRDTAKLDLAIETLQEAIQFSPRNQQTFWGLGQAYIFQGKFDEAITNFQKAVDLEPNVALSHWYLGMAYSIVGKYDIAINEIKKAEELGYDWKSNINDLKKVIDVYTRIKDEKSLMPLYEIATNLEPENVNSWGVLADLYAQFGERQKAKYAAEQVLRLKPELAPQIEQFLKELGY